MDAITPAAAGERTDRAAHTLAYFEGSDAFDGPDTMGRQAARDRYRQRVAVLLARTGTVTQRPERTVVAADDTVLALSFNRYVTADVLAELTPGEITRLFGALNTIASITQPKTNGGTA